MVVCIMIDFLDKILEDALELESYDRWKVQPGCIPRLYMAVYHVVHDRLIQTFSVWHQVVFSMLENTIWHALKFTDLQKIQIWHL